MSVGKQLPIVKFSYVRNFLEGCETYFIAPTAWYYVRSLGQDELFLAFVLSVFNVTAIIGGPLFGHMVDRFGYPRHFFILTCCLKFIAYVLYSINISGFFPLFGRLISGLSAGGTMAILQGQVALQTTVENRASVFVLMEGIYCLGGTFGPAIGSFITFNVTIWGWHINQGNSPGIVLTMIWAVYLIVTLITPKYMWVETGTSHSKGARSLTDDDTKSGRDLVKMDPSLSESEKRAESAKDRLIKTSSRRTLADNDQEGLPKIEWNSQILCLLFLVFSNESLSSTATFYVPVLALNHFHLKLIHVKLLFLNCTAFTLLVFILFSIASKRLEERKLFVVALAMQLTALALLTSLGFAWEHISYFQNYILLLYICFGMPYFAFPFSNAILSKITNPQNASFYQGVSFAAMHLGIVSSRVVISFIQTQEVLLIYCLALICLWLVGSVWFSIHFKQFAGTGQYDDK
ncbi:uncharacterized protein LOC114536115 [Dendronephthya gigantea]|uniref:uncharacterized protein LOC114536115 n=1 Tax=Dendronephthya gigantea TaxID=151771 RepID=UPI00106C09BC|nr:uncharacterized protein LOC114536115 [Dendronephthya gigantea]XP_028413274.1 uncharacterized protein LOC114536115 [Dendronephthya gigantea]